MAASLKLLPGSTVRWRGRRYLIVDYESLDAIIARQPGKRRLERIPVNEAAPDHASHTPEQIVIRERINCVNSLAHWHIITESESIKEPRGRSRSQSYSQIALLHSHLFLHDQLTFADISGTDSSQSCCYGITLPPPLLCHSSHPRPWYFSHALSNARGRLRPTVE